MTIIFHDFELSNHRRDLTTSATNDLPHTQTHTRHATEHRAAHTYVYAQFEMLAPTDVQFVFIFWLVFVTAFNTATLD